MNITQDNWRAQGIKFLESIDKIESILEQRYLSLS